LDTFVIAICLLRVPCLCYRLRVDKTGGAWCPKRQVERGVREYLQVDLGDVYVLTGVETQGRYDRGRGQEYAEEYTIEYWRPGLDEWRQYSRWDGKQVSSSSRHYILANRPVA
jgi:discoidin domain receptor family protein 2